MLRFMLKNIEQHDQSVITPASSRHTTRGACMCETCLVKCDQILRTQLVIQECFAFRDHSVHAPSQWETTLHCNVVPHWLVTYTKWSLDFTRSHQPFWTVPSGHWRYWYSFDTLRPGQNGRHFADDIFIWILLNENVGVSIKFLLKFIRWVQLTASQHWVK